MTAKLSPPTVSTLDLIAAATLSVETTGEGFYEITREVAAFARSHDFQLLALEGASTQYMWTTWRKRPSGWAASLAPPAAPPDQLGAHDGRESTDSIWVSPREAVEGGESGRFKLPFPTTRNLIRLAKQPSVDAALEHARGLSVVTVMPVMTKTATGRQLRIPREAGYDGEVFEVGATG